MIVLTITHYHKLSCCLDMFKFDVMFGDSFCRLDDLMMGHDSFSASVFVKNRLKSSLKPKMATVVLSSVMLKLEKRKNPKN